MSRSTPGPKAARESQPDCSGHACLDVHPRPQQGDLFEQRADDTSEMRRLLKYIAVDAGGIQRLAADLDVTASAVSRSFNGHDGYEVTLRHVAALLDKPAFLLFVEWLCKRAGGTYTPKRPDRTDAEKLAALTKALRKSGRAGAAVITEAADDLDIEPEAF